MTGTTPIPYPRDQHHAVLVDRITGLRRALDAEMAARARAEAEADEARELLAESQKRLHAEERVTRWLRRRLAALLLRGAWPFALAGLVGGFAAVLGLRWMGWW